MSKLEINQYNLQNKKGCQIATFLLYISIYLYLCRNLPVNSPYFSSQLISVKNLMSCHSFALTHCHKLVHLSVTVSGAFAPVLLYSTYHLVVGNKPYHVFVYQPFLLLVCIHQCLLTDSVDHSRNPRRYLEDCILGSTGKHILFHPCVCHMYCDIFSCFCPIQTI